MYAITCAAGLVGKPLVEELLKRGKKVRAIDKDTYRLRDLSHKGATPLAGDLTDPEFVKTAFKGAEAVFLIIPPDLRTNDYRTHIRNVSKMYADSVRENKIRNVILLSSISAPLGKNGGIDGTIQELENQFAEIKDINVINLRTGFWMENLLAQIEMVTHRGMFGSTIKADISIPMVCAMDIGIYAAKRLSELNFRGNNSEYLIGPKDITLTEATSTIGKTIQRTDLKYIQLKPDDFIKAYSQIGYSETVGKGIVEYTDTINNGKYTSLYKRTSEISSNTISTIQDFATNVFAPEYHLHEVTT